MKWQSRVRRGGRWKTDALKILSLLLSAAGLLVRLFCIKEPSRSESAGDDGVDSRTEHRQRHEKDGLRNLGAALVSQTSEVPAGDLGTKNGLRSKAFGSTREGLDFFISFAGPDRSRAEQEKQGWILFFSDRSIAPGETWDDVIPAALRRSRVVAVLLSEHTADAHYQRDEILLATELASSRKLRMVPVYLDGSLGGPANWEFGLRRFNRIDMWRDGPAATAKKLGSLLSLPGPQRPREPPRRRSRCRHWCLPYLRRAGN